MIWSYNQGVMVGAGVLLYKLTGTSTYLSQAEQTASAAVAYFGTGPTLINQGPAFNAEPTFAIYCPELGRPR